MLSIMERYRYRRSSRPKTLGGARCLPTDRAVTVAKGSAQGLTRWRLGILLERASQWSCFAFTQSTMMDATPSLGRMVHELAN
jgi:hypothetical protein